MKHLRFLAALVFASAMTVMAIGCDNEDEIPEEPDEPVVVPGNISVNVSTITFSADGGTQTLSLTADDLWSVETPSWVTVSPSSGSGDCEVEVTAESNTNTRERTDFLVFTLTSGDGSVRVTVNQSYDDGVIKILAVGNSFTEDCVEQYLWELFDAAGMEAVIANLRIGSSCLEDHYNNALNNSASYSYRKIVDGVKTTTANTTLLAGFMDEDWDYICFHQLSSLFATDDEFYPYLPYLIQYAHDNCTNNEMQVGFNLTWAYPEGSTMSGFANYGNDQLTMYYTIVETVQRLAEDNDIDVIIPTGTAIQNGRNSYLGDTFNRDSQHLNYTYGRYTASLTWFEKFSGIDVTTTTYAPDEVDDYTKDVVTHAAHFAVENPYEINPMTDWQEDPRPHIVYVREICTEPTSVTVAWNVDGCEEQEASTYAYDFGIYRDEACTDLVVKWSSDAATGSGNGESVWRPGNTARVYFTFSALEPATDYWVKVNIQDNPDSTSEPFKVTTEPAFGAGLTVVTENAKAGDVILVEGFDKLVHCGDPLHKSVGVLPDTNNRETLVIPEGDNPSGFSLQNWRVVNDATATFSPFHYTRTGNVGTEYTIAAGLSDWCSGVSTSGTVMSPRPGYMVLGVTTYMGYLGTPELKAIPEGKVAKVKVEFQAMPYHYSSWNCQEIMVAVVDNVVPDSSTWQVSAWGNRADNGVLTDSKLIDLVQSDDAFTDYSVELEGVTSGSRIRISGYDYSSPVFLLDNIVITVVDIQ